MHRMVRAGIERWNGIAYYVVVAVPVVQGALALGWPGPGVIRAFGWLLVASTLASIVGRLRLAIRARGANPPEV